MLRREFLRKKTSELAQVDYHQLQTSQACDAVIFINSYLLKKKKFTNTDFFLGLNVLITGWMGQYVAVKNSTELSDRTINRAIRIIKKRFDVLCLVSSENKTPIYLESDLNRLISMLEDILSYRSYWENLGDSAVLHQMRSCLNNDRLDDIEKWVSVVSLAKNSKANFSFFSEVVPLEAVKLIQILSQNRSFQQQQHLLLDYSKNMLIVSPPISQRENDTFNSNFFEL